MSSHGAVHRSELETLLSVGETLFGSLSPVITCVQISTTVSRWLWSQNCTVLLPQIHSTQDGQGELFHVFRMQRI